MELNEAVRRLFGRHKVLIFVFVLLGCGLGFGLHLDEDRLHAATARLVLDVQDPRDQAESQAIADTARGIATGPSLINATMEELGIARDPRIMAKRYVTVEALGSSGVLALRVVDRDPEVAVALANGLAEAVIETREAIGSDTVGNVFREIDAQVEDLGGQIRAIDDTLASLATRIATAPSPEAVRTLVDLRSDLERERSFLEQRRVTLETARAGVVAGQADRPQASIVDPASLPAVPVPSAVPVSVAIGALVGLVLAVAVAATIETMSPTIVGKAALERETGAPFLGALHRPPDRLDARELTAVASHVVMASGTARVSRVGLMATDPRQDLSWLADSLSGSIDRVASLNLDIVVVGQGPDDQEASVPLDGKKSAGGGARSNGHHRTGFVVVTPIEVKRAALDPILSYRTFSGTPLVGVIGYRGRRFGRSRSASRARAKVREQAEWRDQPSARETRMQQRSRGRS